jgi:hypothetical protein
MENVVGTKKRKSNSQVSFLVEIDHPNVTGNASFFPEEVEKRMQA